MDTYKMRTVRKTGALTSYTRACPPPLRSRHPFPRVTRIAIGIKFCLKLTATWLSWLSSTINCPRILLEILTEKSTPSSSRRFPVKKYNAPVLRDHVQIFICIATAGEWNRRMNRVWNEKIQNSLTGLTFKLTNFPACCILIQIRSGPIVTSTLHSFFFSFHFSHLLFHPIHHKTPIRFASRHLRYVNT